MAWEERKSIRQWRAITFDNTRKTGSTVEYEEDVTKLFLVIGNIVVLSLIAAVLITLI